MNGPGRATRRAVQAIVAAALVLSAGVPVASAHDSPGFFYGTDSNSPTGRGSAYPYQERGTGGRYGGYVGEVGTWTNWRGCTTGIALNPTALAEANADESTPYGDKVPGVFFYWFSAGPGADPHYDGATAEAYRWGAAQAVAAVRDYDRLAAEGDVTETTYIPLMFMDIETQPVAGYANGWNERVDRCGEILNRRKFVIPPAVDRATFNGFIDYLHRFTIFHPGVYSTYDFWYYTFGYGPASRIPDTYEWTPVDSTERLAPGPVGFCQGSHCARWFGGVRPDREAGWQWDQNGGDFDQWDTANLPVLAR